MQHVIQLDLPTEGKVRYPAIKRVTGIEARSTIWRWEKAGKFPKSIRITPRLTVWDAGEVRAWLADPIGWAKAGRIEAGGVTMATNPFTEVKYVNIKHIAALHMIRELIGHLAYKRLVIAPELSHTDLDDVVQFLEAVGATFKSTSPEAG